MYNNQINELLYGTETDIFSNFYTRKLTKDKNHCEGTF